MRSRPVKRLEDASRLRRAQFPEDAGAMRWVLLRSCRLKCNAADSGNMFDVKRQQCGLS